MTYVCPHYADPFIELLFKSREEAENYAKAYQKITQAKMKIEEREEDVDL